MFLTFFFLQLNTASGTLYATCTSTSFVMTKELTSFLVLKKYF